MDLDLIQDFLLVIAVSLFEASKRAASRCSPLSMGLQK
jgi:hypothetical protein